MPYNGFTNKVHGVRSMQWAKKLCLSTMVAGYEAGNLLQMRQYPMNLCE